MIYPFLYPILGDHVGEKTTKESILDTCERLLKEQNIGYKRDGIVLGFMAKNNEGIEIPIYVTTSENRLWLFLYTVVGTIKDIEEKNQPAVMFGMMRLNRVLTGAKVAVTEQDEIIVIADTNDEDLVFSEFQLSLEMLFSGTVFVKELLDKY